MEVQGISWLGVRTDRFEEMLRLFRDVMGLDPVRSEGGFAALKASNGDLVELFGPQSAVNRHFGPAPVAGFAVADFAAALEELKAAEVEVVHVHSDPGNRSWAHFRARDNTLYEITG